MQFRGLFIGVDRFLDPGIREMTGCRRDALALEALFADSIPDLRSWLLLDEQATAAAIRGELNSTLDLAAPDDVVVISLSSHGTHDHRLVAYDTLTSDLAHSAIDMAELAQAFKASKARAILCILDCCFSGGAPARVLEDSPTPRDPMMPLESLAGAGRILVAASGVAVLVHQLDRRNLNSRVYFLRGIGCAPLDSHYAARRRAHHSWGSPASRPSMAFGRSLVETRFYVKALQSAWEFTNVIKSCGAITGSSGVNWLIRFTFVVPTAVVSVVSVDL